LFYLGEFASARRHCEQSLALYNAEQLRDRAVLHGLHFGVSCLVTLARILGILGYPDQAIHTSQEVLMLARELAHPFSLGFALNHSALLYQSLRNAHDTQELAEALITLTTEHGFGQWVGTGQMLRGWALAEQEQVEEGLAQLCQGMTAYRDTGSKLGLPHYLSLLAEGYMKVGQAEEAYNTLAEALSVVHATEGHFCEAELYWLKGTFLLWPSVTTSARPMAVEQEAEACFYQAFDIARHQQAKSVELRATLSLSRLWQRQGKQAEARRMLAELYSWFTEGFDTADLQQAKALLEELG
jgi:predicted ATPase